jgi:uncharacterized membrane protein
MTEPTPFDDARRRSESGPGARPLDGAPSRPIDGWERLRLEHEQHLWTNLIAITLGFWLISSPAAFGYASRPMTLSDVASGTAVILLGLLSLAPQRFWASWAIAVVGIWVLFAPLVFWAQDAAAFTNALLVGALLILLTVLIPGFPGLPLVERPGPEVPAGWSYNPSSWLQRLPIIALGLVGFFIARYLATYQLGYRETAWDPIFGDGTRRVLESDISKAFPVSDAGLGAVTYLLEVLVGSLGGPRRWRTMPWAVMLFGVIVVPLGVTSIVLVILQPIGVGAWCTLCLVAAFAMLLMVPLAVDEVVATLQYLARSRRQGAPLWQTFWFGGTDDSRPEPRTPALSAPLRETVPASAWGVTAPWSLIAVAVLGTWVMIAPTVFGSTGWAANSSHLTGALIVTIAAVAFAEVMRPVRFLNVLLGLWVVFTPLALSGASGLAVWSDVVGGVTIAALSLPRGAIRQRYGGLENYLS